MTNEKHVLAIDLGTSGCKAALVSCSGRVIDWAFHPVETQLFPNHGAEQNPEDWWNALLTTARELLARGAVPVSSVAAVCCNTQGEGTVPVDADGKPLMNAILWMDARGAEGLRTILGGWPRFSGYGLRRLLRWIRLTGGAPSLTGKDPAAHMLYIKERHPDVYASTHKFLNVVDFLNLRLTGRYVATYDSILTSWVTDNRDASNVVYSEALLRDCGIDREKFPEIVRCTDVVGPAKADFCGAVGLPSGIPVVAGAVDTTAAAVGSGAVGDFEPHLYLGTSSWVAAHVPFKKTNIFHSMASLPCAVPGRHLLIAMQSTAGGNLNFLREKILYHKDELLAEEDVPDVYKIMDRIVTRTPAGSNGVFFAPWSWGERCPVEDRTLRAAFYNLSLENTREDLIRAVYEGIAYNTRWMMPQVERFLGRPVTHLTAVGGGAVSDIWCQILADVMNIEIRQLADPIQANVRGAALIAAVGLGELRFEDIPDLTEYRQTYAPIAAHRQIYDDGFRTFLDFYKRNRRIFHRLNVDRGRH